MCHKVIALRSCYACGSNLGETVVDFTECARKCGSPFFCLTPDFEREVCDLCASMSSSPVMTGHSSPSAAHPRTLPRLPTLPAYGSAAGVGAGAGRSNAVNVNVTGGRHLQATRGNAA